MESTKEIFDFLILSPKLLIREYRDKKGVPWKVTWEDDENHVTIQIGDNSCISSGQISGNIIDDTYTIWRNGDGFADMYFLKIQELAEKVTAIRSMNTVGVGYEWEKTLGENGFYGARVILHFCSPVNTAYSKKEKATHTVYLLESASGLCYSQRNRTGHLFTEEMKDNLITISKS